MRVFLAIVQRFSSSFQISSRVLGLRAPVLQQLVEKILAKPSHMAQKNDFLAMSVSSDPLS